MNSTSPSSRRTTGITHAMGSVGGDGGTEEAATLAALAILLAATAAHPPAEEIRTLSGRRAAFTPEHGTDLCLLLARGLMLGSRHCLRTLALTNVVFHVLNIRDLPTLRTVQLDNSEGATVTAGTGGAHIETWDPRKDPPLVDVADVRRYLALVAAGRDNLYTVPTVLGLSAQQWAFLRAHEDHSKKLTAMANKRNSDALTKSEELAQKLRANMSAPLAQRSAAPVARTQPVAHPPSVARPAAPGNGPGMPQQGGQHVSR